MNEGELLRKAAEDVEGILGRFLVFRANISIKWPDLIGLSFQMALSQHLVTPNIRP